MYELFLQALSRGQSQRLQMEGGREHDGNQDPDQTPLSRLDVAFTILRDPSIQCDFIQPYLTPTTTTNTLISYSFNFNARYIDNLVDVAVDFLKFVVSLMTTTATTSAATATATTTDVTHTGFLYFCFVSITIRSTNAVM
eukprot:CAMPEP_0194401736 /NCGR_PEP_ID=MMETSP0176-20130528/372_1 /TAXON_ID=216777 /ORGANISM="Proboscia alata, Strain PI-D3" /LENGTH=139 /DNA_ID=CAMNT_0039198619 /DNA_START=515 /DNA_END=934 /DNA_ORIENTATION=-